MRNKFTWLLVGIVILTTILSLCFINSEWFINQTMPIKQYEMNLDKKVKQEVSCKYENHVLKIKYTMKNVDDDVLLIMKREFNENETILTLIFLDKDGFKIAEQSFSLGDFSKTEKGVYTAQKQLVIDKSMLKRIKDTKTAYKPILVYSYKELEAAWLAEQKRQLSQYFEF